MYCNIHIFEKSGLLPPDLVFLCAIHQKEVEWVCKNLTEDVYNRFEKLNLIKHIKAKATEHKYKSVRISDVGKKLLVKLSYEGAPDQETELLTDWLVKVYKNKSGGIVKNKTEIKRRIMWFKTVTQIRGNRLAVLLQCFIQDTYSDQDGLTVREFMDSNSRGVLNNCLDNLCWSPSSHFDKNYTLDKSPLYNYYEDNQDYIENIWKEKNL